nr:helix-turn-helix transcriptional regulator [uncultured Acetatifactor sp.]
MGYSRNRISAYHYQESEVYIIESKSGFYDQKSIMEINLKDTLRNLRRAKNITQETLADYLGITPQSVGKWERGEGYPDITMLPKIAIYFDVTVDELLDVSRARIEERIQAYRDESMECVYAGDTERNIALWEKAYGEFPNDCRVMSNLMGALQMIQEWKIPQEVTDRMVSLGERILQESRDTKLREDAISALCYTYKRVGDDEKALHYANMGGSLHCTKEVLVSFAQEGEEGIAATQEYIRSMLERVAFSAGCDLLRKGDYSTEERIHVYEFCIKLLKLPVSEEDAKLYADDVARFYQMIAWQYAYGENAEKTLEALENMTKYAVIASEDGAGNYRGLLVNRLEYDSEKRARNYRGNACNLSLDDLKKKEFDFVRQEERFRKVVKELEQNALTV